MRRPNCTNNTLSYSTLISIHHGRHFTFSSPHVCSGRTRDWLLLLLQDKDHPKRSVKVASATQDAPRPGSGCTGQQQHGLNRQETETVLLFRIEARIMGRLKGCSTDTNAKARGIVFLCMAFENGHCRSFS
jgi:hypothetical protein